MSAESESCDEESPALGYELRSFSTHFHKKNVVLEVRDASFQVQTRKGPKWILDDMNLVAESGESYALMGPSGAGKTTFLELMTLGLTGGKISGRVTLNNKQLTFESFRRQAVYVEQYDTHWAFLTCRETMLYAARLYIPGDREEQEERVEHVMEKLGLLECANAYAGNKFFKGMSGGQKKRLTLGMALLKAPVLMLLDEPTSGLDAASTASVMTALKDMCKECNLIAIATIHQPSTEVFMGFSRVMFMANGRTAYCGETSKVAEYCATIGHPLPPHTNPADFFIELVNSEFAGREAVEDIVKAWGRKHVKPPSLRVGPLPRGILAQNRQQIFTVLSRQALLSIRDPTLYLGRMGAFLIANSFFAMIYWMARPLHQEYAKPKFYLVGWFIAVPTLFALIVVFAANEEFILARKEIKNGMLKTGCYLFSSTFLTMPYMLLLSCFAILVPAIIADHPFTLDSVGVSVVIFAICLWTFESMGQFIGVLFKNTMAGMLAMMFIWFTCFLFMGSFLQAENTILPFGFFMLVLPLKWTCMAMSFNVFSDSEWEGAVLTEDNSKGFVCPNMPAMNCYGKTGTQVLTSLAMDFSDVSPDDRTWECALWIALCGSFFKALHIGVVYWSSRVVSEMTYDGDDSSSSDDEDVTPKSRR